MDHARKWDDFFWATIFVCFETDTPWSTSISETDKKSVCLGVKGHIDDMCYTVRCRYCAVISLTNILNRHHITRPLGSVMGCLLWIQHLIDVFAWVPVTIYVISYNIGPRHNGTQLYMYSAFVSINPRTLLSHDDVIKWRQFPCCWTFVPVTGEFPSQGPEMESFDVFFDLGLKKTVQ